jgi:hypothetical protein
MCGLSSINTDAHWASIEYAIFLLTDGRIFVYESGVYKGSFGTYQSGDSFSVERIGSDIYYKKNNDTVPFYTSLTQTTAALLVDCAIYDNGGEISDVKLIGTAGPPEAITDLDAATASPEIDLTWTAPGNNFSPITEYEVQYGNGNFNTIFTDDDTPGVTITGLTNGVEYQFRVVAKNALGTGPASNVVNAIPVQIIVPTWVDTVGVDVDGNTITKTAPNGWGNGGAASLESFTGDGGVGFIANQTNTYRMCGLSSINTDAHWASIEYAIFLLKNGRIMVFESGVNKGSFGAYQIGDSFSVERIGSTIYYKKNNVIFYTSVTPTDSALLVDSAIQNTGGKISDVRLFGNWSQPDCTDNDGDGYGVGADCLGTDCDDGDPAIYPGAEEVCDGVDNNCNGQIDEGIETTYYEDLDGDGYGNPAVSTDVCTQLPDYVTDNTDCDDSDPAINPGAGEICGNGIDEDCDGQDSICVTWTDTVGVTVDGNTITKTAPNGWGNGGAASLESFTGDGGVGFIANQTNTYRMCGLSSINTDAHWASIEYAIFLLKNGRIMVFESGVNKGFFGAYQIGDSFSVERIGSTIYYKKNNVIFYTSVTPTDSALLVDSAIQNTGGKVSDVKLLGSNWIP